MASKRTCGISKPGQESPDGVSRAFGDEVTAAAGRAAPESPNILVIMSDEHHWGLCGFNGIRSRASARGRTAVTD